MRRAATVVLAAAGIAVILASVGGPAAVASYHHAANVARKYGETPEMAAWLPLTTDGMLVAALAVMYAHRWRGEPVGRWPWVAFVFGTVATLAANLAAADLATATSLGDTVGRLSTAVWPPIAFALTLELVALMLPFLRPAVVDTPTWPVTWRVGIPVYPYQPPAPEPDRSGDVPAHRAAPWSHLSADPWADAPADWPARTGSADQPEPAAVGPLREWIEPPGPVRQRNGKTVVLDRTSPAPDRTTDRTGPRGPKRTVDDDTIRAWIVDHRGRTGSLPTGRAVRDAHGVGPARAGRLLAEFAGPDQPDRPDRESAS